MMSQFYHDQQEHHRSSSEKKRSRGGASAGNNNHDDNDNDDEIMDSSSSSSSPAPFVNLPFYGEHKRAVSSVKFAPSRLTQNRSDVCASASSDGTVKIWDLSSSSVASSANGNQHNHHGNNSSNAEQQQQSTLDGSSDCHPNKSNNNLPSNSNNSNKNHNNSTKYLLNPATVLVGHSRGINDVAWSSDAPMVATASDDKTLRLWDAQTSDALVEFRGHDNFVFCTQIYHNLLVSGSFDETIKIWDVRNGECVSTLPVHSDPVTAVSFNRDGTCLVSASHDGLIRIWDVATGECLKTIYAAGNPPVSHVTYSPNGKYILAGTLDSKLRLWNVNQRGSNKCTKTYEAKDLHVNNKYCIVSGFLVSRPDRQYIFTGSETGKIILYDINSRKVQQVLEGHADAVLAVDAHDKKELIASGGMTQDKTVQFWAPQSTTSSIEFPSKRAKR